MKQSENFAFNIPELTDYYSVNDYNVNFLLIDMVLGIMFDTSVVDEAFEDVYGDISPEPEVDPHALPTEDVAEAMDTEWHGESSTDPNAISSTGVENAMDTEWHGETSSDDHALQRTDIETITD